MSVEQCRDLVTGVEAARSLGVTYMLGENSCVSPRTILIKNLVNVGLLSQASIRRGGEPIGVPDFRGGSWRYGATAADIGRRSGRTSSIVAAARHADSLV